MFQSPAVLVILRFFHVTSGVLWVGAAAFLAFFLEPTTTELGPDGGKVMQGLDKRGLTPWLSAFAGLTLLSGLLMYFGLNKLALLGTGTGIVLTLGAVFGIIGFAVGMRQGGLIRKMQALGAEIAAGGGPPSPEQGQQMGAIQATMRSNGRIGAVALVIAVICMGIFQYVWF